MPEFSYSEIQNKLIGFYKKYILVSENIIYLLYTTSD